jgi:glycosyltransferase involved in cell wall biosynthesis
VFEHAESDRIGIAALELRHLIHAYRDLRNCDIVHDHTLIGPVYAGRFPDLPVVTTNHGPFNAELTDLYAEICNRVPIIAISHHQASTAEGLNIAAVIHHGLDVEEFPHGRGLGDDHGPYLLFLGRMAPEKGARRAALLAKQAGVRLKIAAKMREPWEHQFFEQMVEPLLDDQITYVGEVGRDERLELLRGAQVLVNPIRWPEPFGLVMIESLACGTPVLAFKEGAAPEIIDDGTTGFICDDLEAMVEAVTRVDTLDRAACVTSAETRFSTERMVSEHLELFKSLLDN